MEGDGKNPPLQAGDLRARGRFIKSSLFCMMGWVQIGF